MKRYALMLIALIFALSCGKSSENNTAHADDKPVVLETQMQKVSYSIGLDIGRNLANQGIDLDRDALAKGINDVVTGICALWASWVNSFDAFDKITPPPANMIGFSASRINLTTLLSCFLFG